MYGVYIIYTRYVHAYTQCILALPVLETCGTLGVEGDLSL